MRGDGEEAREEADEQQQQQQQQQQHGSMLSPSNGGGGNQRPVLSEEQAEEERVEALAIAARSGLLRSASMLHDHRLASGPTLNRLRDLLDVIVEGGQPKTPTAAAAAAKAAAAVEAAAKAATTAAAVAAAAAAAAAAPGGGATAAETTTATAPASTTTATHSSPTQATLQHQRARICSLCCHVFAAYDESAELEPILALQELRDSLLRICELAIAVRGSSSSCGGQQPCRGGQKNKQEIDDKDHDKGKPPITGRATPPAA